MPTVFDKPAVRTSLALSLCLWLAMPLPMLAASKPRYLPPLAPHIDASAFQQPQVKPAPSPDPAPYYSPKSSAFSPESQSSSASDNQSDRTKQLLRQALELHSQGDLSGASREFKEVLSIDPQNSDANYNLGAMAEDQGDLKSALSYYEAAARSSPSDSDIRNAISSVQDKMRQQQQAQQTARAVEQKAQMRKVAGDAASAYKAGHYDQAISNLQQILNQDPNDSNALFAMGQAWRGKGDKNRAYDYLQRALAVEPNNQLYQATMNDLKAQMQQQQVASDGMPPAAPDYHHRGGYGQSGGASPSDPDGLDNRQVADNSSSSGPAGGVTPFTSQGEHQLYGHAYGSPRMGMGMGMGGLGMMGALGAGALGGGLMGRSYYGGRGTRLVRGAVAGSLAGAAIGGLMNMHGYGGFRAGAMRGALQGGLMGLIMGF